MILFQVVNRVGKIKNFGLTYSVRFLETGQHTPIPIFSGSTPQEQMIGQTREPIAGV